MNLKKTFYYCWLVLSKFLLLVYSLIFINGFIIKNESIVTFFSGFDIPIGIITPIFLGILLFLKEKFGKGYSTMDLLFFLITLSITLLSSLFIILFFNGPIMD